MVEQHIPLGVVARRLDVSERTVRRWIKSGELKAYRPGRDYRIPESALREFVEKSEAYPKVQAPLWLEPEQRREESQRQWAEIVREVLGVDVTEVSPTDPREERESLMKGLEEIVEENSRLKAENADLRQQLAKAKETV